MISLVEGIEKDIRFPYKSRFNKLGGIPDQETKRLCSGGPRGPVHARVSQPQPQPEFIAKTFYLPGRLFRVWQLWQHKNIMARDCPLGCPASLPMLQCTPTPLLRLDTPRSKTRLATAPAPRFYMEGRRLQISTKSGFHRPCFVVGMWIMCAIMR